jgi:NADH-quinone oxidoreductase subunit J
VSALLATAHLAVDFLTQQQPAAPAVAPPDHVGIGEAVAFWVLGPISVGGGLGMVFSRGAVHSALWLALTMLCLGGLYMVQQAPFLGFVQIIVYTGAVMMLFLFVLMLVGRDSSDSVVEVLRGQRLAGAVFGIAFAVLLASALVRSFGVDDTRGLAAANAANRGNVDNIGRLLFTDYLFPFELTSALLMTAAIGAMVLAYVGKTTRSVPTQREQVIARLRGTRISPLPGPGVFATADSVATPALLPDGSVAPESLSEIIESTARDTLTPDLDSVAGQLPAADAHALVGGGDAGRSGTDDPAQPPARTAEDR